MNMRRMMNKIRSAAAVMAALLCSVVGYAAGEELSADRILEKVEKNISADNRIVEASVVVHGKRSTRTFVTLSYTVGDTRSFTEYLQPAREKGTKMLKLEDDMWIYSPSTDRTIMISGHMLRQSVMGSDMSYEDLMEDRKIREIYHAELLGREMIGERECYKLKLTAKVSDIAYPGSTIWVDTERFVPLRQEYFAKSGQHLKTLQLFDYRKIDGYWTPTRTNYKDEMKDGKGTDMIINKIQYNEPIPEAYFTKGALKK